MTGEFEAVSTGVAGHVGNDVDAMVVPAGVDVVHTSGTPGLRSNGTLPEDFAEEVTQAWRNVAAALNRAGADLTDVVAVRQWLTDDADIPTCAAVRSALLTHQPVSTLAVVRGLVWPNMRVCIEVIAIRHPAH